MITKLVSTTAPTVNPEAASVEHQLEVSELRYQTLFENSKDAIMTLTLETGFTDGNNSTLEIFGFSSKAEFKGKHPKDLSPISQPDGELSEVKSERMMKIAMEKGYNFFEWTHKKANGKEFPATVLLTRTRLVNLTFIQATVRDITEQKKAEKDLKLLNKNLETIVNTRTSQLLAATKIAEAANLAKTKFLANISHELRTPMHGIINFTNFIIDKAFTADRDNLQGFAKEVKTSSLRLLDLLNNLLTLTKLDMQQSSPDTDYEELHELVTAVSTEFKNTIAEKKLQLEIKQPLFNTTIKLNPEDIKQVIRNILSNAIKFSPQGGIISVSYVLSALKSNTDPDIKIPGIQIFIADQGVGIPENELEIIFDKFVQSTATDTGAGGTGLGLSICKEIINQHNGKIWAENNKTTGSTFKFILPYIQNNTEGP
jgi:PAS domain S-box-containing protein